MLGSRFGHNIGNAFGVGDLFGESHHQPRDGNAARRAEKLGLIVFLYPYCGSWPDHVFRIGVEILLFEVGELLLEAAHPVLKVDNKIPWDLSAFRLIEIFAVGVRAFAWQASR